VAKAERGKRKIVVGYGEDAEIAIGEVEDAVRKDASLSRRCPPRWLAIKLLENDEHVLKLIETSPHQRHIIAAVR
jgi:ferrous iron transport protein B